MAVCETCKYKNEDKNIDRCLGFNVSCDNKCKEYWLDWLKQEVGE